MCPTLHGFNPKQTKTRHQTDLPGRGTKYAANSCSMAHAKVGGPGHGTAK